MRHCGECPPGLPNEPNRAGNGFLRWRRVRCRWRALRLDRRGCCRVDRGLRTVRSGYRAGAGSRDSCPGDLVGLAAPEDVPTAVGLLEDREVELAAQVEPLPGAARLLADLPNDRCAIVTSASRRLLLARLSGSGLSAPDVLITADDVALGKPDPEAYTAAAAQLGVPARGLVVFEDAPAGLRAARDAGAVTVGLTTTHAPDDLEADYHIPNLSAARMASLDPLALALS